MNIPMNKSQKKKLMFAAMSSRDSNPPAPSVGRGSPVESGAVFRSVSMGLVDTTPTQLFMHNNNHKDSFSKTQVAPFAAKTPVSEASIGGWDLASPSKQAPSDLDVDTTTGGGEFVWNIPASVVPPVPLYHPLERTAVTVTDLSLDTITARVSTFLKQQSIPAQYTDQGRVQCMTEGLLKFVIQLWQGQDHTSTAGTATEGHPPIVIEVQRRQGCCVAMQAVRHNLLEAVLNGTGEEPVRPTRKACRLVQEMLDRTNLPPPPAGLSCGMAALDVVRRLLLSNRLCAQRLGLESLVSLTNPSQVLLKDADEVSRTLLTDRSWHDLLGRYLEKRLDPDLSSQFGPQQSASSSDFHSAVHLLTLKSIAQAVESGTAACSPAIDRIDVSTDFWSTTLQVMCLNIMEASTQPLEAAWSIRCFRHLQAAVPELLQVVPTNKSQLVQSLKGAHDFGKLHNQSLEAETKQWMGRLGIAV